MKIEIRLFATLRQGRWKKNSLSYENRATPRMIIKELDIDQSEVAILLHNGMTGNLDVELNDGDILSIFPPVGGG